MRSRSLETYSEGSTARFASSLLAMLQQVTCASPSSFDSVALHMMIYDLSKLYDMNPA
eukprot:CAMPEP_0172680400 /NCGR_PEP_ID=MMETSP1074-20121228/16744_1 /TAXON_ID=2916 /ORGANISM="Ceratium fusus, Strain PA161109" /LENGTH=57 /DNA_ID=CAMNT_0013498727 /DNA_START=1 /DNA_END=170 /DNA_ORIENTATION=+